MKFVITLTHTPEQCFGRKEYMEEFNQWIKQMRESAKKLGIKIEGAYITPNEHTFYFILECSDFKSVSNFLGPPMLTHHSARIAPIIDLEEATGLSFMQKR